MKFWKENPWLLKDKIRLIRNFRRGNWFCVKDDCIWFCLYEKIFDGAIEHDLLSLWLSIQRLGFFYMYIKPHDFILFLLVGNIGLKENRNRVLIISFWVYDSLDLLMQGRLWKLDNRQEQLGICRLQVGDLELEFIFLYLMLMLYFYFIS